MASVEDELQALKAVVKGILDHMDRSDPHKIEGVKPAGQRAISSIIPFMAGRDQPQIVEIIGTWVEDREAMLRKRD